MMNLKLHLVVVLAITFAACTTHQPGTEGKMASNSTAAAVIDTFVCMPCGQSCDSTQYSKAGTCSHCNMQLVKKATAKIDHIDPDSLCKYIANNKLSNTILLDVRTSAEFAGTAEEKFGRLTGAINIPVQELVSRISSLDQYKNSHIIVYCSHSHRSPMATYLLKQHGFTKVKNMLYGMSEWQARVKSGCSDQLYIRQ
jgi:rhodanese-related sulfurtransferase/DNA-directed RNA polymerase subunit RPC12/RpoP